MGLNSTWNRCLYNIRNSVLNLDEPGMMLDCNDGLWELCDMFYRLDIPFGDFLDFKGIFSTCHWYYSDKSTLPWCNDIVADLLVIPNGYHEPQPWKPFIHRPDTPKETLIRTFEYHLDIHTQDMATLRFKNPFEQIINNEIDAGVFERAQQCLKDYKFNRELQRLKVQDAFINNPNQYSTNKPEMPPEPAPPLHLKKFFVTKGDERIQYNEERPCPNSSKDIISSKMPSPGIDGLLKRISKGNLSRRTFERNAVKHFVQTQKKIVFTDSNAGLVWIYASDKNILTAVSQRGIRRPL